MIGKFMLIKSTPKKMFLPLFYLLIFFLLGIPLFNILRWKLSQSGTRKNIKIVDHRGAGGLAPENTLDAIDSGLKYKAEYIEIDIRQTMDNEIVVIHDRSVDRTSDGSGYVHKLKY